MMTKDQLRALQVGDEVVRLLGDDPLGPSMGLRVTEVTELHIECGAWLFDRNTGGEIDEDLGWDGVTLTGSRLVRRLEDHNRDTTY